LPYLDINYATGSATTANRPTRVGYGDVWTIQPDVVRGRNTRPRLLVRYQCILLKDEASSGDRWMDIVGVGLLYVIVVQSTEFFRSGVHHRLYLTGGLLLLNALVQ